jgi:hypothetical protein
VQDKYRDCEERRGFLLGGKASALCNSGVWYGSEMFGGTILTVGCGIDRGDLQWQASAIRAFLSSGFHSKTG